MCFFMKIVCSQLYSIKILLNTIQNKNTIFYQAQNRLIFSLSIFKKKALKSNKKPNDEFTDYIHDQTNYIDNSMLAELKGLKLFT